MTLKYIWTGAILLIGCISITANAEYSKRNVICYLASWANYRTGGDGQGRFVIEDINPLLCTHAVYAFSKLENGTIATSSPLLDLDSSRGLGWYKRFNNLRQDNPELKTLISIGGWNEGSQKYSQMTASAASRKTFIDSVVTFLDKYRFNGLDIDWEYPANRGGVPEDKQNFVLLLKELRAAFEPHGYLLTAAVAASKRTVDSAYDIPQVSKYLNFIHVMSYNFYGAWKCKTGIHAPLYADVNASEEYKQRTVDYAIQYWIDRGAAREKIVMGVRFYGRSFTLENSTQNGIGAPTVGKGGEPGIYTKQTGTLSFNEICLHLTRNGWTEVWNDTTKASYSYKGNQWVGYDNKQSVEAKADYIKQKGLAGAFIWSVDADDFRGTCCGQQHYLQVALTSRLW